MKDEGANAHINETAKGELRSNSPFAVFKKLTPAYAKPRTGPRYQAFLRVRALLRYSG